MFGCSNVRTFENLNVRTFDRSNVQTLGRAHIRTFRHSEVWTFGCVDVRTFQRSNVRMLVKFVWLGRIPPQLRLAGDFSDGFPHPQILGRGEENLDYNLSVDKLKAMAYHQLDKSLPRSGECARNRDRSMFWCPSRTYGLFNAFAIIAF